MRLKLSWAGHGFGVKLPYNARTWLVASFGFRLYLHFFDNYGLSYGSLGALMILLVWLYATGLALLIGAEINAEIEHAGRRQLSE